MRIESAAPPRESPSSLVKITPESGRSAAKRSALRTASWPVIASATNSTSSGARAAWSARSSSISASSTWRRPAVSKITVSRPIRRASASARSASASTPSPGSGVITGVDTCAPTWTSCSTAAARWRSPATSTGCRPRPASRSASLPAVVVLPEPWSPHRSTTAGRPLSSSSAPSSPRSAVSSSRTILITCCAGVRLSSTSAPAARSRTRSMNGRTTRTWTSASSSASRICRSAAASASSLTLPSPLSWRKTSWSLPWSPSNMVLHSPSGGMVEDWSRGSQGAGSSGCSACIRSRSSAKPGSPVRRASRRSTAAARVTDGLGGWVVLTRTS